jgi:TPR repeat protein
MRSKILLLMTALALAGCEPPNTSSSAADASSLTQYDLSPDKVARLADKAEQGDADAAVRLAEFYTFAGGEGDPNIDEPRDGQQRRRWLAMAAAGGRKDAAFNLAVETVQLDCPRARRQMQQLAADVSDPQRAKSANAWLDDPSFQCRERKR